METSKDHLPQREYGFAGVDGWSVISLALDHGLDCIKGHAPIGFSAVSFLLRWQVGLRHREARPVPVGRDGIGDLAIIVWGIRLAAQWRIVTRLEKSSRRDVENDALVLERLSLPTPAINNGATLYPIADDL